MERIKLYISWYMEANESFLSFYSRLSAQAACCNWTEQEERSVIRDLFIGRIRGSDVQSTLIGKNPGHTGTLKQSRRGGGQSSSRKQNAPDRKNQNHSRSCYFCGNTFSTDHRKNCAARDVSKQKLIIMCWIKTTTANPSVGFSVFSHKTNVHSPSLQFRTTENQPWNT